MSTSFHDPQTNTFVQIDPEGGTHLSHERVALLSRYHRYEYRQMTPPIPGGQSTNHDFAVRLPDGERDFFLEQLQQETGCTVTMVADPHDPTKWHVSMNMADVP